MNIKNNFTFKLKTKTPVFYFEFACFYRRDKLY